MELGLTSNCHNSSKTELLCETDAYMIVKIVGYSLFLLQLIENLFHLIWVNTWHQAV